MRHLMMTAAIALLPLAAPAQEMTEEQIKQLALEAILENPQIIMEAVAILDQQREAAQAAAGAQALQDQRNLLVNDPNAPSIGDADAGAVIVEFFDYNCPYCRRAYGDVKALMAADDDVRVVLREWPILGEGSVVAARAALAADMQGKYEEMHVALMEQQGRAEEASVMAIARDLDLDIDQLMIDMQSDEVTAHIDTSRALAQSLGFTGTPAFVIGDALVPGAIPLEELQNLVDQTRQEG